MDPYQALGVSKTASQDEIRQAFRKLARQYHPDLNPGDEEAERKFKDVNAAYELIETEEKRKKFDEQGTEGPRYQDGQGGGFAGWGRRGPFYYQTQEGAGGRYSYRSSDLDDEFFESIFGTGRGRGRTRHATEGMAVAGEDQLYEMEVDFRDAALGAEREITLPGGKRLRVKIPGGVESGARLRFPGQGGPGFGGAPSGEAYVTIRVRPSEQFRRRGEDLESDLKVPLEKAVLGGELEVPTLDGKVMLRIPAGVSSGSRLRLRGKGVVKRGTGGRGDQFVVVQVSLPEKRDPGLEAAIREWVEKRESRREEAA